MHVPLEVFRLALVLLLPTEPHRGQIVHKSILSIPAEGPLEAKDKCVELGHWLRDHYKRQRGTKGRAIRVICKAPVGDPA